jgi:hypothetical protein
MTAPARSHELSDGAAAYLFGPGCPEALGYETQKTQ